MWLVSINILIIMIPIRILYYKIHNNDFYVNIIYIVYFIYINYLPVVPARGGAEVALKIYMRPFSSIELACAVRQPSLCVRALCEGGVLFHMSHLKLHFALHTPHLTLHSLHSTLHTSHSTHMNKHSCKTHRRNDSCTKRPQPQPSHTPGTFHRRLQPLYTEKHKVSCAGFLPTTYPTQHSCSHSNAICNQSCKKRIELRTHEQAFLQNT